MKKLFILFICLYSINAFAYYTETIPNQCGIIGNNLHAAFEINTYTCQSGEFLPADALGCVSCPNGYTCNGGTYEYNPTISQGIEYKNQFNGNIPNACSYNFEHELIAMFEPNTITLNWNDGTNITTTQCTFGETITIPNPPTRPGYKFGGWRVKRRN